MYHAYACTPTNCTYDIEPAKYGAMAKKNEPRFGLNVELNFTKNVAHGHDNFTDKIYWIY